MDFVPNWKHSLKVFQKCCVHESGTGRHTDRYTDNPKIYCFQTQLLHVQRKKYVKPLFLSLVWSVSQWGWASVTSVKKTWLRWVRHLQRHLPSGHSHNPETDPWNSDMHCSACTVYSGPIINDKKLMDGINLSHPGKKHMLKLFIL